MYNFDSFSRYTNIICIIYKTSIDVLTIIEEHRAHCRPQRGFSGKKLEYFLEYVIHESRGIAKKNQ